jgi:hypothetical protein
MLRFGGHREIVERRGRVLDLATAGKPGIEAIVSKQEPDGLLVELHVLGKKSWMRLIRIGSEIDHFVFQQRRLSAEHAAAAKPFRFVAAEQTEYEVDRWPLARHVVLQIRIKPFITKIELRGERN